MPADLELILLSIKETYGDRGRDPESFNGTLFLFLHKAVFGAPAGSR